MTPSSSPESDINPQEISQLLLLRGRVWELEQTVDILIDMLGAEHTLRINYRKAVKDALDRRIHQAHQGASTRSQI